jgi:hypothetical protein
MVSRLRPLTCSLYDLLRTLRNRAAPVFLGRFSAADGRGNQLREKA